MRIELETFVERVLGAFQIAGNASWGHGESCVLRIRGADGSIWYSKCHRRGDAYARETAAYRKWVPALGTRAPRLRACDDELQMLLVSAVPGTAPQGAEIEVHHQAGALLRRFHDAAPGEPWPDFAASQQAELERWISRSEGILEPGELEFVRSRLRELDSLPEQVRVPCHLDYTPRNWLVADHRLHVIDFEWPALDVWVNDIGRLHFGIWQERPDLRESFLDGYGRRPSESDLAVLASCHALKAAWMMIWAREHGDTDFECALRVQLHSLMRGES